MTLFLDTSCTALFFFINTLNEYTVFSSAVLFKLLRLTGRVGGTLPLTVLKVLASLACHGNKKKEEEIITIFTF